MLFADDRYKKNKKKADKFVKDFFKKKKVKEVPEPKKETKKSLKGVRKKIEDIQEKLDKFSETDKKYQEMIVEKDKEIEELKLALNNLSEELDTEKIVDESDILKDYIKEALKRGLTAEEVEESLISHGWDEKKVNKAFKKIVNELR